MTNQLLENIGLVGVGFYLSSYALLQMGLLRGNGYAYVVMNLIAASLVLVSLQASFNMSSAIIQIFWIVISIFGIARLIWLNMRIRFTPDEEHLLKILFPTMDKVLARKFLDTAKWYDLEADAELTTEDMPVTHMTYLSHGSATVMVKGKEVGSIKGGLIGEINVLSGGAATATVRLNEVSRVLVFPGQALRELSDKDRDFRFALENAMKQETGEKLRQANQRLAEASG